MASRESGFSILELTAAMTIMLAATAVVFAVMLPSSGTLAAQSEAADMQQRLRVAADSIGRDLVAAGAPAPDVAAIRPYRAGPIRPDPPGTFSNNTITVLSVARVPGPPVVQSVTYWQQSDPASGTYQLMSYDGSPVGADVPVVDHTVAVTFEYFGDPQPPIATSPLAESTCLFDAGDPPTPRLPVLGDGTPALVKLSAAQLTDGPWCPDATAADRWDADLLRIRRIAITLRVEAAVTSLRGPAGILFVNGGTSRGGHAWLPDIEMRFDIAPRNLNLSR